MRIILFHFALILFLTHSLVPGKDCTIRGKALDINDESPLVSAVVKISPSEKYTISKEDGSFQINDVPEGDYILTITHLGYRDHAVKITASVESRHTFVIFLTPVALEISPVVVAGEHQHKMTGRGEEYIESLAGRELQKELGMNLASTLKDEAGIAMRSMGPAPARPVIRGMNGDRVVINEDGHKTSDLSATSPDHAVTIEQFTVDRIEVIRGPDVLRFTSSATGGVVNVIRHEIPAEWHKKVYINSGLYAESVNKGYLASLTAEAPVGSFIIRGEISGRKSADLSTPGGSLNNSDARNLNYSGGASWFYNNGYTGISYRRFALDYGIPGGFEGGHPNGVDIELFRNQLNFISEYNFKDSFADRLRFNFNRTFYRHKEFEKANVIGSEFRVMNLNGNLELTHNSILSSGNGRIGISSDHRDFDIGGFVFTPPARSTNISFYLIEDYNYKRLGFEAGMRFGYDNISPLEEDPDAKIGYVREKNYRSFSLSVSLLYRLTNKVSTGLNIYRSSRVPTLEELFSEGPHLAAYSYETGNPELNVENGWGMEYFVYHKFHPLKYSMNLFYNNFSNFIIHRNSGETNYQTFLPVYSATGIPAFFAGIEFDLEYSFETGIKASARLGYTYAENSESGTPLPEIPPLKTTLEICYRKNDFAAGLSAESSLKQERTDEFEQPTAGYLILNGFLQYSFETSGMLHMFSIGFDNILNQEYRNHLSRIKSILPEPGTNIRLTYKNFLEF